MAIRNVVNAAEALGRAGRTVTYLNIGDPQAFGFRPPDVVVEPVVARAARKVHRLLRTHRDCSKRAKRLQITQPISERRQHPTKSSSPPAHRKAPISFCRRW